MISVSFPIALPIAFALAGGPLPAVAAEIHCPNSISETPTVSSEYEKWIVVAGKGDRQLEHAGIYLGAPSEFGAQVPDSTKSGKNRETVTWRIFRSPTDTFWVGCSYIGTTAMLFQKLDANITACVATYDLLPTSNRQRLHSMNCR